MKKILISAVLAGAALSSSAIAEGYDPLVGLLAEFNAPVSFDPIKTLAESCKGELKVSRRFAECKEGSDYMAIKRSGSELRITLDAKTYREHGATIAEVYKAGRFSVKLAEYSEKGSAEDLLAEAKPTIQAYCNEVGGQFSVREDAIKCDEIKLTDTVGLRFQIDFADRSLQLDFSGDGVTKEGITEAMASRADMRVTAPFPRFEFQAINAGLTGSGYESTPGHISFVLKPAI